MKKQQKQTQSNNKKRKILLATLIPTATIAVTAAITLPIVLKKKDDGQPKVEGIPMTYQQSLAPGSSEEVAAFASTPDSYQAGKYVFTYTLDNTQTPCQYIAIVKDSARQTALSGWTVTKITRNGVDVEFSPGTTIQNTFQMGEGYATVGTFKIEVTADAGGDDICLLAWYAE